MTGVWKEPAAAGPHSRDVAHQSDPEGLRLWLFDADRALVATLRGVGSRESLALPLRDIAHVLAHTGATRLVLAHSHPSGDPRPSEADIAATRCLWRLARALGASLHDHVIIGHKRTFSFRENGML